MFDSAFSSALRCLFTSTEGLISSRDTEARACVTRIADILFVTFRGIHVPLRKLELHDGIIVNGGFWSQFIVLEPEITQRIKENPDIRTIIFAGHSTGGAIAQLAAAHYGSVLEKAFRNVCHTFGSPRVGNKNFVKWFSDGVDENIRVQNHKDPVPMTPFGPMWVHTFDMAWTLYSDMSGRIKLRDTPWYKRPLRHLRADPVEHQCKVYIERLED